MQHTVESLIAFRQRVVQAFREKQIRSPIHLNSDAQAKPLIGIFKRFRPGLDYLFSNWRSSWHCLLAGMPEEELFAQIVEGRSMFVCSKPHRILCSSIVGGVLPIAAGVAMAIQREHQCLCGSDRDDSGPRMDIVCPKHDEPIPKVWICIGDMTRRTGLFNEFRQFCQGHSLPVRVICENNGLSTDTETKHAWGQGGRQVSFTEYFYDRNTPHVGIGERIQF